MSIENIKSPFFYFEASIKVKRDTPLGLGHLPAEIQDRILDQIPIAELKPRVCRKFAAVWLDKAMRALSGQSRVQKVAFRSLEQCRQVENFFEMFNKLPKSMVFPESSMPTIPIIQQCFNRLWNQIREGIHVDPLTERVEKFQKHAEGRKFLRNLPAPLVRCHSPIQVVEMSDRMDAGEPISDLVKLWCFNFLCKDGSGHFPSQEYKFYSVFFTHVSLKALSILMKRFGNQFEFHPILCEIFKEIEDQQLACQKFYLLAKGVSGYIKEKNSSQQMPIALGLIVIADHFNSTCPDLLPLNELLFWIPNQWKQINHPHLRKSYSHEYIEKTLKPIYRRLFKEQH